MSSTADDPFDLPEIFLTLGLTLGDQGKGLAVRELVDETLERHAGDPLYRQIARFIQTRGIPSYHTHMLADIPRNQAYARAIEASAKGRVVLDIGTGSGLLAMLAARAGAARVIACEANPQLAATARKIIADNGYADRIEVHGCHSGLLDRKKVVPDGIDLVVSEIFAADLVEEGVLRSLEHARTELAAPGALFIPESAAIRVALADFAELDKPIGNIEGFDLSAFEAHVDPIGRFGPDDTKLILRSAPADLAQFAFACDRPLSVEGRTQARLSSTGGRVRGAAQWLRITFGPDNIYENAPGSAENAHWCVLHHPFAQAAETAVSEEVAVEGWYYGDRLAIWRG